MLSVAWFDASAEPAGSSTNFLLSIVQADLIGDASARLSHVKYSSATDMAEYERRRKVGGPVPEVYALDIDPLVVVTDWELASIMPKNVGPNCQLVNFKTVAKTVGEGLPSWETTTSREFIAVSPPQMEAVRYCATKSGGSWMLIDPPLPRLLKRAVVVALQTELEAANRRIKNVKTTDSRAMENMLVIRNSFARQLGVIRNLPD